MATNLLSPQVKKNVLGASHGMDDEEQAQGCIQRIKHLKTLFDNDMISQNDFETRKSQIVDELTGTSSSYTAKGQSSANRKRSTLDSNNKSSSSGNGNNRNIHLGGNDNPGNMDNNNNRISSDNNVSSPKKSKKKRKKMIEVIKHGPPDWSKIRSEKAEKYTYNINTETWVTRSCKVKIDEVPFDKGGLRYVFHLQDLSEPDKMFVAKMSQDMKDNIKKEIYFNDVRMQAISKSFCHGDTGYNAYSPPKKVDFLEAFVLHLKQREGSPVCHVERFIDGTYKKYNNNVGWVSEDARNTPHAFAHFTYEASKGKLLVCDIQGVADVYTDPQVHSSQNLKAFGRGNLGVKGFENFLRTHRCNPVCQYLKLKNINKLPIKQMGTLPQNTQIMQGQVNTVPFDFEKSANAPLLSDQGFPKIVECATDECDDDDDDSPDDTTKCMWCTVL